MAATLKTRAAPWAKYLALNRLMMAIALQSELCRCFMTIPGVGPIICDCQ